MGRPGWHIECSAMSKKHLGDTIDIHAGGQDLQFPHHENEIAQSECCNGVPFANYWMHNGYITIDNEKMSKSKGNFFTVRDILKDYDGEVIRFFLLSGHYRNPINFSDTLMEQAKAGLARMQHAKENLKHLIATGEGTMTDEEKKELEGYDKYLQEFIVYSLVHHEYLHLSIHSYCKQVNQHEARTGSEIPCGCCAELGCFNNKNLSNSEWKVNGFGDIASFPSTV